MKMIGFILVCGLAAFVHGTPTLPGPCPDLKAFENIDAEKSAGEWLEHFHGKVGDEDTKPLDEKCEKKVVTARPDGGFDAVKTYLDSNGKSHSKSISASKLEGTGAKYSITGDEVKAKGFTVVGAILDTDYTNRLTSVSCVSDGSKHGFLVGVYGRGKTFSAADADMSREALKSAGIDVQLSAVEQSC